ncbi:reverse transcriptase/maturase family protein [Fructilactobacillus hinvesii]|uniref:Reverse transcriptase/maturase family protein n=1 Tax=Fructilactobacillus hinvesii TaxID=2940300 RepID=A0ABY5BV16_9LACO|nr:reverse transcriptase/maturase family protein [Fructilactobacillus hinvesii]USS88505.1 reverse transcriptase/maturase family protein [Fructilactobacillus hinvesii]
MIDVNKLKKEVFEELKDNSDNLINNYIHFDSRFSTNSLRRKLYNIYKNKNYVSNYRFLPFITVNIKKIKYNHETDKNRKPVKYKNRLISLAGHEDALIYSFYGKLLSKLYESYISNTDLNNVVLAYRSGKSNITGAKDVIDFIWKSNGCWIIKGDFSNFFDNLNHHLLLSNVEEIFSDVTENYKLNDDWKSVLTHLTKYRYIEKNKLLKGLGNKHFHNKYVNNRKEISELVRKKAIHFYKNRNGIPQGTSLSAVLANVYMIKFDNLISKDIKKYNGIYRRYSDDFVIVIPNNGCNRSTAIKIKKKVINDSEKQLKLKINDEKTKLLYFSKSNGNVVNENNNPTSFDYLGFSFNGNKVFLRNSTIYRFWYRGKRASRTFALRYNERELLKNYNLSYLKNKYIENRFPEISDKIRNKVINRLEYEKNSLLNGWSIKGRKKFTKMYLVDQSIPRSNLMWYADRAQKKFEEPIPSFDKLYKVDIIKPVKKKILKIQSMYHNLKEKECKITKHI